MSNHNLEASRQIWTEYWRGSRRSCLTDELPASAGNHIVNLWRTWFQQQPQDARVIDLACGAGDVAGIALSVGAEAGLAFGIEGVDLAEFDRGTRTQAAVGGSTMRLQGGIDIARLPFPEHSFDCAVSQFGVEYADRDTTSAEITRVLRPGARGLFLLHHRESAISVAATARLQAFDSVVGERDIFGRARLVYEAISKAANESVVTSRLAEFRRELHSAVTAHSRSFGWERNLREILAFLSDLARDPRLYDPIDALRRLDNANGMVVAWKSRQQAQLAAALDESGIAAFAEAIGGSGLKPLDFRVVTDPVNAVILAWELTFVAKSVPLELF